MNLILVAALNISEREPLEINALGIISEHLSSRRKQALAVLISNIVLLEWNYATVNIVNTGIKKISFFHVLAKSCIRRLIPPRTTQSLVAW